MSVPDGLIHEALFTSRECRDAEEVDGGDGTCRQSVNYRRPRSLSSAQAA